MQTIVVSNGSKWAGDTPDDIEKLLSVLSRYTLDPVFEKYGNFIYRVDDPSDWVGGTIPEQYKGMTHHISGNFFDISHVFSIFTNDQSVVDKLSAAISTNQQSDAYFEAKIAQAEIKRERRAEENKRREDAKRWRV